MGGYGMGGYGMNMMGGMGMGMGGSYLFSLNQLLFSIQSVVFSTSQAIQIVGMNAQQIQNVLASLRGTLEHCVGSIKDYPVEEVVQGVLGSEAKQWFLGDSKQGGVDDDERGEREPLLSEEEIVRRRRLQAFRWTMALTLSYVTYRTIRKLIRMLILGGDSSRGYASHGYGNHGYLNGGGYTGRGYGRRGGYGYDNGYYGGGYGGRSHYDPYGGSGYY